MKTHSLLRKLLPLILALLTGFILFSCKKVQSTLPDGIIGTWVETNTLSDTIFFSTNNKTGMFSLHRGYEIRNGYRLPIIGSTIYSYKIFSDSISVQDGLSSAMDGGTYYFKFDESNLTINIGKFSKYINTDISILTFRKIN
jgi:hypothetical protein